jgi:hypothetical protein
MGQFDLSKINREKNHGQALSCLGTSGWTRGMHCRAALWVCTRARVWVCVCAGVLRSADGWRGGWVWWRVLLAAVMGGGRGRTGKGSGPLIVVIHTLREVARLRRIAFVAQPPAPPAWEFCSGRTPDDRQTGHRFQAVRSHDNEQRRRGAHGIQIKCAWA